MKTKRFITSGLIAALVMFTLSYVWHGVVLNDFKNISLPFWLFISLSVLVYLLISFLLMILLLFVKLDDGAIFKKMLIGGAFGFFIYLVVIIMGKSYFDRGMEHLVIDFAWQMIEQSVGAFIIAFSVRAYARMDAVHE